MPAFDTVKDQVHVGLHPHPLQFSTYTAFKHAKNSCWGIRTSKYFQPHFEFQALHQTTHYPAITEVHTTRYEPLTWSQ